MTAIKLYRHPISGHAHRVELFLSLLKLPFQLIDVDLRAGAHKSPDFLKLNTFGQIPVLDDNGLVLADSNAILVYLAKRYGDTHWLPEDPVEAAHVQRWLSVAAGELVQGPAQARIATIFGWADKAGVHVEKAHKLLALLNEELAAKDFLSGATPTIADIALYTYTAHAPEGGVTLENYPKVGAWLARIEALPGFVPMIKQAAKAA